jgi:hypothetical protein
VLVNGAFKRKCQRSGCIEYAYVKIGMNFKVILCKECRESDWNNEPVAQA